MRPKKALCIGIAEYQYLAGLKNPIHDADDVANKFFELGYEATVIYNPTRVDFLRAWNDFIQELNNAEVAVIYYAGHGIQCGGINYLVPSDANPLNEMEIDIFCIPLNDLVSMDSVDLGRVNLFILDACRDDPFARTLTRGNRQLGFAPILAPSGTLISFSTSPGKTASDGEDMNGLFTKAFLTEVSKPDLSAIQVFQNVRQKVLFESRGHQLPWESTSLLGDFYFNPVGFNLTDIRAIRIRNEVSATEQILPKCKEYEIEVTGQSAEGGQILAYQYDGNWVKIAKRLYGESGRLFQDVYLKDQIPFFYRASDHTYNVPYHIDEEDAKELGCEPFDESKTKIRVDEYFIDGSEIIGHNLVQENEPQKKANQNNERPFLEIEAILEHVTKETTK